MADFEKFFAEAAVNKKMGPGKGAGVRGWQNPYANEYGPHMTKTGPGAQQPGLEGGYGFQDELLKLADVLGMREAQMHSHPDVTNPSGDPMKYLRRIFESKTGSKNGQGMSNQFGEQLGQSSENSLRGSMGNGSSRGGGFQGRSFQDDMYNPPSLPRSPNSSSMETLLRQWMEKQQNPELNNDAVNAMRRYLQMINPHKR